MSRPASSSSIIHEPVNLVTREIQGALEQHAGTDCSREIAGFLDEEQNGIQGATELITRIILLRLTTLPTQGMDAEGLFHAAREFAGMELSKPPASYIDNGYVLIKGSGVLADLFGDHYGSTVNAVSMTARIKSSSVHTLMCLLASFIFHYLGSLVRRRQIGQQQLISLLRAEYPHSLRLLPERVYPFLEWIRPAAEPSTIEISPETMISGTSKLSPSRRRVLAVGLLLLAALLVILLTRPRKSSPGSTGVSGSVSNAVQVVGMRQEDIE